VSHDPLDLERLNRAYQLSLSALLQERHRDGYWVGELSTSALSTATAVSALALVQNSAGTPSHESLVRGGLHWLTEHQNSDGGWGDTVKSISNISTTMLGHAAFYLAGKSEQFRHCLERAETYLQEYGGKTSEEQAEAVRARYGKDRTFAVPILTTCALTGLVSWKEVRSLPFELACLPQSWFRFLRLPVVSYALPALIAIGQAVYCHRRPRNPVTRLIRRLAIRRSLCVLEAIQPSSGGFLEAVPLTSFVTLSLASIGHGEHPVTTKAVEFLTRSVRPDGSWPIDSNLSVWLTTLAVNSLAVAGELPNLEGQVPLREWLIRQQFTPDHPCFRTEAANRALKAAGPMPSLEKFSELRRWVKRLPPLPTRHPYTGCSIGGWGWTHLPGSVPDGDDTPGALLALFNLHDGDDVQTFDAAWLGVEWLFALQNSDGGWPTFCRGWGNLPFDRSGVDLTAHAIRALAAWRRRIDSPAGASWQDWLMTWELAPVLSPRFRVKLAVRRFRRPISRGLRYLASQQRPDGSWLPLWFGSQFTPNDENPTYGTARVLAAYRDLDKMNTAPARRGVAWLLAAQNADGGWGGAAGVPSSMEETALAVEILVDAGADAEPAVNKGLVWLVQQVELGRLDDPAPIGFYFAKLWYYEKLYPIIFTVAALGRALRKLSHRRHPA
jgi:squalene-hopene/tetraprenyl-beta-curcumene cyclase